MTTDNWQMVATHFAPEFEHYGVTKIDTEKKEIESKKLLPSNMHNAMMNFALSVECEENKQLKGYSKTEIIAALEKKFATLIFDLQISRFEIDSSGNLLPFFQDGFCSSKLTDKIYNELQEFVTAYLLASGVQFWTRPEVKKQVHLGFQITYQTLMYGIEEQETKVFFNGVEKGSMPAAEFSEYVAKIAALNALVY